MTQPSARHRLTALATILLAALALSAADARRGHPAPAPKTPLLTIHQGGCRFRPEVEAIFRRLGARLGDAPPNKAWMSARFAFGPLHGIGVAAESHSDFSGEELYFREDQAALKRVLGGIGLHVDRNGDVVEAAKFTDGGHSMVSVSIHGIDAADRHPHYPAARSWIGCGSL